MIKSNEDIILKLGILSDKTSCSTKVVGDQYYLICDEEIAHSSGKGMNRVNSVTEKDD